MREIRFRAWDKRESEMIEDYGNTTLVECYGWGGETYIPMQFTGLSDRDGNEVYEGDILETADRILKVVWHRQAGQWDTDFIRYKGELSSNGLRNLEWKYRATVIGNIYENPELL